MVGLFSVASRSIPLATSNINNTRRRYGKCMIDQLFLFNIMVWTRLCNKWAERYLRTVHSSQCQLFTMLKSCAKLSLSHYLSLSIHKSFQTSVYINCEPWSEWTACQTPSLRIKCFTILLATVSPYMSFVGKLSAHLE